MRRRDKALLPAYTRMPRATNATRVRALLNELARCFARTSPPRGAVCGDRFLKCGLAGVFSEEGYLIYIGFANFGQSLMKARVRGYVGFVAFSAWRNIVYGEFGTCDMKRNISFLKFTLVEKL